MWQLTLRMNYNLRINFEYEPIKLSHLQLQRGGEWLDVENPDV